MKKSFLFAIITLLLVSPTCFAYKISTSGKTITLKMKHPSVGIVGLNAVGWEDDPNEIQKDIYDLFRGLLIHRKKEIILLPYIGLERIIMVIIPNLMQDHLRFQQMN